MSPIERAARAICRELGEDPDQAIVADGDGGPAWRRYVDAACAAMEAFREPDKDMIEAGAEIIRTVRRSESDEAFANDAENTWRYMIEAGLGAWR